MAPQQRSNTRQNEAQNRDTDLSTADNGLDNANNELFLEPMMGTPLAMYIEKDVQDRDNLAELVTKYGGMVSPGYSGVPYILVDPHKESGQSLYRQYAGKKGKIVLDARWIYECIRAGELQTFHSNWASCRVTGAEQFASSDSAAASAATTSSTAGKGRNGNGGKRGRPARARQHNPVQQHNEAHQPVMSPITPSSAIMPAVPQFPYQVPYNNQHPAQRPILHPPNAVPQNWQDPNNIATHEGNIGHSQPLPQILPRPPNTFDRPDQWNGAFANAGIVNNGSAGPNYYDNRFRGEWGPAPPFQQYHPAYPVPEAYMQVADPLGAEQPDEPQRNGEKTRGRKRTRAQATPAPPASTLVLNRRHPPARSPTPPSRVIKSTYGGNLFTADDVLYLKKYIDYCQEQGLVLSLREICERVAIKAPHHTFYSWRRYCNKHQIRLGGYAMDVDSRSPSVGPENQDPEASGIYHEPGPGTVAAAQLLLEQEGPRNRSPTPPRALYRSTTGKGVAFTNEDVAFLVKLLAYRKFQGRLDMVTFWKDVAAKAPHHSRASWMKYYRRHKHELNHVEGDEPLPAPPNKKMRYGKNDDILLAKYFVNKPIGTSDQVFQDFARTHSHHPWKGWQEHHRIHKAKIDHLIQRLANGESIDDERSANANGEE